MRPYNRCTTPPLPALRFGSDADVGCFADAGAWMALTAPLRAYVDGMPVPRDSEQLPGGCERVTDESQQADLVTFTAESGGVVWLGRTKTGDVAAIVVTSGMPGAKAWRGAIGPTGRRTSPPAWRLDQVRRGVSPGRFQGSVRSSVMLPVSGVVLRRLRRSRQRVRGCAAIRVWQGA